MPIKKALKPYEKKSEATKHLRPRLEVIEEILMLTTPKWNGKKYKPTMTLNEACDKVGISPFTLRAWRMENPKIAEYFNNVKAARKEMVHNMMETAALQNVMEGIGGGVKLRPLDKINISLRYLEKTSPEFNPSIKLETDTTHNVQFSMGSDEMQQRIMELAAKLGINNLNEYANNQGKLNPPTIPTIIDEEQTGDGENAEAGDSEGTIQTSESEGLEES